MLLRLEQEQSGIRELRHLSAAPPNLLHTRSVWDLSGDANEDDTGYLVIGPLGWAGGSGSVTTGETVDVYPCTIASIASGTAGRNEPAFAVVEMAVTSPPSINQTV